MQCGNEIITLQFGSFANFIAAHYFNIQEAGFSYSSNFIPDILPHRLFRASEDVKTGALVSYNPRTVLVDDNFGDLFLTSPVSWDVENACDLPEDSLNFESLKLKEPITNENKSFMDDMKKSQLFNGAENPIASSYFLFKSHYKLKNITKWPDFLKTTLHPRSITVAPKEFHLSSRTSSHYYGAHCSKQITFWEQIEDNIRYFAEECDNLQGFQIISEGHTAFSGVATTSLYYLKDEFGKKASIFIPTYFNPEDSANNHIKISSCNTVSCIADAKESADLIIPISLHVDPWCNRDQLINRNFRNTFYKKFDTYECSAVLAGALELITLPYRMRNETNISMSDYCKINKIGRCISIAGTLLPFPMNNNHSLNEILKDWDGSFFESISPLCYIDNTTVPDSFYTFSKGVINDNMSSEQRDLSVEVVYKEKAENLKKFIQMFYFSRNMNTFLSKPKFRVPPTFPDIFNNVYNLTNPEMAEYGRISEFYGLGCLINSKEIKTLLNSLHTRAAINFPKISKEIEESSEIDFSSVLDNIATLAFNYSECNSI